MRSAVSKHLQRNAKRFFLASILLLGGSATGQVVDLPTTPLGTNGNPRLAPPIRTQGNEPQQGVQPRLQSDGERNGDRTDAGRAAAPSTNPQGTAPSSNAGGQVELNLDPNATIDELTPSNVAQPNGTQQPGAAQQPGAPPRPVAANFGSGRQRGLGATRGSFSSAPNMIGDIFGGSFSTFGGSQTVRFSQHAPGTVLGVDGGFGSTIAFEFGTDIVPNDVFTTGTGFDLNQPFPDGNADTFNLAEPLPPNDALTSPGPGFLFDGGTAVYTNNNTDTTPQAGVYTTGDLWYIDYSYTQTVAGGEGGRPVPGPGVAARRVKLSENFSPEVRDRCFATYNFFNDAYGGLGDVSRYVLGFEKVLIDETFSVETRMLMAGTYASTQVLELNEDRDFEFGNCALIGKAILLRTQNFLWSGGLGVTLPTADDTRIKQGGQDVFVVKNRTVHLLPFSAMLFRLTRDTAFQAYMQLDVATNGDPIFANLTGGPLPQIGKFNDSSLMNIDLAFSHTLYRNPECGMLRQLIGNAELHYSGTLQESDIVTDGSLTYTNLKRNFNVLNATGGCHFVLCNNVVVTPAMSIPLRDGLDEQFDYEAIVQLNYIH